MSMNNLSQISVNESGDGRILNYLLTRPTHRVDNKPISASRKSKHTILLDHIALIPLSRGLTALVDLEDAEWLSAFSWYASPGGESFYAMRSMRGADGKQHLFSMHRLIMDHYQLLSDGQVVDHINGHGIDNRKQNLRACTNKQNIQNQQRRKSGKFKGVFVRKGKKYPVYSAKIAADGKYIDLASYATPEIAAQVYNIAAWHYYGEFANVNHIPLELRLTPVQLLLHVHPRNKIAYGIVSMQAKRASELWAIADSSRKAA